MLAIILAMCSGNNSTWNAQDKSAGVTLSNADHTASFTSNMDAVRAITSRSSGKGYFEAIVIGSNPMFVGIGPASWVFSDMMGLTDANSAAYYNFGQLYHNTQAGISVAAIASGDIVSVAVDKDNHLVYFAKNGTWVNSGNPSAGTGGIDYVTTDAMFPAAQSFSSTGSVILNSDGPFIYSLPTGYDAWG